MDKLRGKENFAVIGLGQFGGSICRALVEAGEQVLAIDKNEEIVDDFMNIATRAVIADAEDEDVLKNLSLGSFDYVFISIGEHIQASIMATLIVKELGAKHLICKAENSSHARVLEKIGADKIIQPEKDMGKRVALHTLRPNIVNYLALNDTVTLAEVKIENSAFDGHTLAELAIREKYDVTVIAITRNGRVDVSPLPDAKIHLDDTIAVVGDATNVDKFNKETD